MQVDFFKAQKYTKEEKMFQWNDINLIDLGKTNQINGLKRNEDKVPNDDIILSTLL